MRRLLPLLLLVACRTAPQSDYVPGGEGLPASARADYRRALARERAGDIQGALGILDELATGYPTRLGFHLRRLALASRLKGPEYAAGLYDPPPQGVGPERAGVFARLVLIPAEDVVARKELIESATAREPADPFWRLALADVELTAHDLIVERANTERGLGRVRMAEATMQEAARVLERARQEAETALQYDPGFKEAQLMLGYIASRRSDLAPDLEQRDAWRTTAAYHYEQALALDPASVSARVNLAENLLYFDEYTDAARQLKIAVELAPGEPMVWNNLGYTYYATGRTRQAIACYRQALKLDPGLTRTRVALSDGLRRQGETKQALDELARARADVADDRRLAAEIAFKLATMHEQDGRYREAVEEYEQYIKLGGSDSAKARWRIRLIQEGAYEK